MDGGVFGLLRLIALHRGAVEYDLRQRFRIGLRDIGDTVTLFEVARLVVILRKDPSSAIASTLEGWEYPVSREALILMDHYDLDRALNHDPKKGKADRYPRPYEVDDRQRRKYGNTGGRTRAEIVEILNGMGHNLPVGNNSNS